MYQLLKKLYSQPTHERTSNHMRRCARNAIQLNYPCRMVQSSLFHNIGSLILTDKKTSEQQVADVGADVVKLLGYDQYVQHSVREHHRIGRWLVTIPHEKDCLFSLPFSKLYLHDIAMVTPVPSSQRMTETEFRKYTDNVSEELVNLRILIDGARNKDYHGEVLPTVEEILRLKE